MRIFSKFPDKIKDKEAGLPNDRRALKRYDLPLKLNYCNPITKHHEETMTTNISRNGLRFTATTKIPNGTVLDLKIEDPFGDTCISSKAKIVWTKEFISGDDAEAVIHETGVRFLKNRLWS